jgi:hypothetical protein
MASCNIVLFTMHQTTAAHWLPVATAASSESLKFSVLVLCLCCRRLASPKTFTSLHCLKLAGLQFAAFRFACPGDDLGASKQVDRDTEPVLISDVWSAVTVLYATHINATGNSYSAPKRVTDLTLRRFQQCYISLDRRKQSTPPPLEMMPMHCDVTLPLPIVQQALSFESETCTKGIVPLHWQRYSWEVHAIVKHGRCAPRLKI